MNARKAASPPPSPARLAPLAQRQQALLQRSAALRRQFAQEAQALRAPLGFADRLLAGWRWLRAHPEVPLAAGVVLVVMRPRRAWRLGWRAWSAWRLWQKLQPRLQRAGLGRRG